MIGAMMGVGRDIIDVSSSDSSGGAVVVTHEGEPDEVSDSSDGDEDGSKPADDIVASEPASDSDDSDSDEDGSKPADDIVASEPASGSDDSDSDDSDKLEARTKRKRSGEGIPEAKKAKLLTVYLRSAASYYYTMQHNYDMTKEEATDFALSMI